MNVLMTTVTKAMNSMKTDKNTNDNNDENDADDNGDETNANKTVTGVGINYSECSFKRYIIQACTTLQHQQQFYKQHTDQKP